MTTKRITLALLFLQLAIGLFAQMDPPKPTVFLDVDGKPYPMKTVTSQTEQKKGWDIQGKSVGGKKLRYFWREHAHQLADTQPRFAIYPQKENLNDYALIRLKSKRQYRRLPDAQLTECPYIRVDLNNFRIESLPEMGFAATPLKPLEPGEYILVNLVQQPVNDMGDIKVYDFSIPAKR